VSANRISVDFSDDIKEIALEIYNRDDRAAQRKVQYIVNELPVEQRLKGLFRLGSKICMMRSIVRADLRSRALGVPLVLEPPTIDLLAEPPPLPPRESKPAAAGDAAAGQDALTEILGGAPQP